MSKNPIFRLDNPGTETDSKKKCTITCNKDEYKMLAKEILENKISKI